MQISHKLVALKLPAFTGNIMDADGISMLSCEHEVPVDTIPWWLAICVIRVI